MFYQLKTSSSIHVDPTYPRELEIKDTTESPTSASYLDILLKIDTGGKPTTLLYDKRDDFNFALSTPHTMYIYVATLCLWRVYFSSDLICKGPALHKISF
jgi:hypothetical protein